jgi:hypothetical protein
MTSIELEAGTHLHLDLFHPFLQHTTTSTNNWSPEFDTVLQFILAFSHGLRVRFLLFHGPARSFLRSSSTALPRTQEGGSEVAPLLHHSDLSLIRRTIDL